MMKILVLGSKGMAGHVIKTYLESLSCYEIHDLARDANFFTSTYIIDVSQTAELISVFEKERYDFVINCIGSLNKDAEDNPDKAIFLNSYLPHFVAKYVNANGGKLIHISTDCVFSGATGGYLEHDIKDGRGYYARSKALGEIDDSKNLTLRTSIIGPELKNGIGLFHWFMKQEKPIIGFEQAWWSGVTTIQLAKTMHRVLQQDFITGIYHLTNNNKINKYELLTLINQVFNKSTIIQKDSNYKVDKSLIDSRNILNDTIPSYLEMITEMKEWINLFPKYYSQYT